MTAFLDLFSGIGGFALGAYMAGLRFDKHYFSEIEDYAIKVYKRHFPNAENIGDIRNVNYSDLPRGEWLVTGGFPCQPHSVAGLKKGAEDERDLWPECRRMLRDLQPRIALFENVRGLLVSPGGKRKGEFFNGLLSDIHKSGYDAEWKNLSAYEIGAPHKRSRLWIIAYPSGERWEENVQKNKSNRKSRSKKPKEWEFLFTITARNYIIQHWENYEQALTGNYDGLPEILDAIKGIGNSVVPQCVEKIMLLPAFDRWRKKIEQEDL